ncbi:hypothetical protein FH972_016639 [Carpinus fangiana]|uniref:DUF7148 domain-containing protein n=1 Tax=Carpinus fangiana TaxID=176857 RepID=A0A5N6RJF5_9ROSI|nr:hypothetical protein FH972_016639 [Carpinus fangiana]
MAYALHPARVNWHLQLFSPSPPVVVFRSPVLTGGWNKDNNLLFSKIGQFSGQRNLISVAKSSPESGGIVPADDADGGISLGTMKLPPNTDLQRFETLLFQWANSLSQGANLPLPEPLKVGFLYLSFLSHTYEIKAIGPLANSQCTCASCSTLDYVVKILV